MKPLNKTQAKVLAFISRYIKKNGYSPTMREVSDHFGWSSVNAAAGPMWGLAKKGYLEKTSRGYRPTQSA